MCAASAAPARCCPNAHRRSFSAQSHNSAPARSIYAASLQLRTSCCCCRPSRSSHWASARQRSAFSHHVHAHMCMFRFLRPPGLRVCPCSCPRSPLPQCNAEPRCRSPPARNDGGCESALRWKRGVGRRLAAARAGCRPESRRRCGSLQRRSATRSAINEPFLVNDTPSACRPPPAALPRIWQDNRTADLPPLAARAPVAPPAAGSPHTHTSPTPRPHLAALPSLPPPTHPRTPLSRAALAFRAL